MGWCPSMPSVMAHPGSVTDMMKTFVAGHPDTAASPDVFETTPTSPTRIASSPRRFPSGATRDQDTTKFDYEGFLSPLALTRFAAFMHKHRVQSDGSIRDSDNWQKGMPRSSYMKSLWRHLMTVWGHHREVPAADCEDMEDALCGVIFNAQGYLHEIMKAKRE